MSFSNDPNNPIDRVRMLVGDTDPQNEYLSDQWYIYFLDKSSNNETLAAISAAKSILVKFTSNTREKVDQVEIWGNEQFQNYLDWLKDFIENPSLSGLRSPTPYAGGISKSDMRENDNNPDNNTLRIKTGFTQDDYQEYIQDYWIYP